MGGGAWDVDDLGLANLGGGMLRGGGGGERQSGSLGGIYRPLSNIPSL